MSMPLSPGLLLSDHEHILAAANDNLKLSKEDVRTQHTKVIALLNLDRYEDALNMFNKAGDGLRKAAPLAWCYTLYKCGRLGEAIDAVRLATGVDRALMHVEAQAAYRSEDFNRAAELYERLSQQDCPKGNEYNDLRINSVATDAQLTWASQSRLARKPKVNREDLEQFETAFNAACVYIARGDLKQAHILLNRAEGLCNAAEELSSEDKTAELLPIHVQQIYVLSRLGKTAEAQKICDDIDIAHVNDGTERYIAQTNMLASSSIDTNPYLTHRLLQTTSMLQTKSLPFNSQTSVLDRNALALAVSIGKQRCVTASISRRPHGSTSRISSLSPSNTVTSTGVFLAAAYAHRQDGKNSLKDLLPLLARQPRDVGLLLTIVQLYVIMNDISTATSVLESFLLKLEMSGSAEDLEVRFMPGLVAILVSLYGVSNRAQQSKTELVKATGYWQVHSKDGRKPVNLFKAAGAVQSSSFAMEELSKTNKLFETALLQEPSDRMAIAGLVASTGDPNEALTVFKDKLPAVQKLLANIDVTALEKNGVAKPPRATRNVQTKKRLVPGNDGRLGKSKKAKRNKVPKHLDPARLPDPERWLPLRDRSNWKPKGRKKGRVGMSTQGGIVSEESRPGTPSSQVLQQGKGGNTAKAKKRKGIGGK